MLECNSFNSTSRTTPTSRQLLDTEQHSRPGVPNFRIGDHQPRTSDRPSAAQLRSASRSAQTEDPCQHVTKLSSMRPNGNMLSTRVQIQGEHVQPKLLMPL